MIALGEHPADGSPVVVRIGRFGPYVQVGEGESALNASIPEDVPPAEFTLDEAIALVDARTKGPSSLGTDSATGLPVYVMTGRFGPYVQLGETPEKGSKEKPRRASLTADDGEATITLDRALELLSLPRLVGLDADSGEEIVANFGRFGPYIKRGSEFRSLASDAQVFDVSLDEAIELFRQEKPSRRTASNGASRARRASGLGSGRAAARGALRPVRQRRHHQRVVAEGRHQRGGGARHRGRPPPRSRGGPEGRSRAQQCRAARRHCQADHEAQDLCAQTSRVKVGGGD